MAEILVLVDHVAGRPRPVTAELLTLAARLGEPVAVAVGDGASDTVEELARYGAAVVCLAPSSGYDDYLAAPVAVLLAQLVGTRRPRAVLVPAGRHGTEVAALTALHIDAGVITDAIGVDADLVATKTVIAGSFTTTARVTRGVPVISVAPGAVDPVPCPSTPEVVAVDVDLPAAATLVRVVARTPSASHGRPALTEAAVVVAGGRGMNGDFEPVFALADALGGAVGASRAAVDEGWCAHAAQVGQTGSTVTPRLYVAAGISGALQHVSGMRDAGTVVAVNTDPDAPIFDVADLGIVGDVAAVLPQAASAIRALADGSAG